MKIPSAEEDAGPGATTATAQKMKRVSTIAAVMVILVMDLPTARSSDSQRGKVAVHLPLLCAVRGGGGGRDAPLHAEKAALLIIINKYNITTTIKKKYNNII